MATLTVARSRLFPSKLVLSRGPVLTLSARLVLLFFPREERLCRCLVSGVVCEPRCLPNNVTELALRVLIRQLQEESDLLWSMLFGPGCLRVRAQAVVHGQIRLTILWQLGLLSGLRTFLAGRQLHRKLNAVGQVIYRVSCHLEAICAYLQLDQGSVPLGLMHRAERLPRLLPGPTGLTYGRLHRSICLS